MKWTGNVARRSEMRNAYNILVEKHAWKRLRRRIDVGGMMTTY
jgi:hypothetical protein